MSIAKSSLQISGKISDYRVANHACSICNERLASRADRLSRPTAPSRPNPTRDHTLCRRYSSYIQAKSSRNLIKGYHVRTNPYNASTEGSLPTRMDSLRCCSVTLDTTDIEPVHSVTQSVYDRKDRYNGGRSDMTSLETVDLNGLGIEL